MRVVAGALGGRRLQAPKGQGVRPTLERVREAIFDTLGPRVAGARVLDLFAGCGALGIEAWSRGASRVVWCDCADPSVAAIRENLSRLGIDARALVLPMPASAAVKRLAREGAAFDLVFVDPPYESELYEEILLSLSLSRIVAEGGVVAVEHMKRYPVSAVYGDLTLWKRRQYGDTAVTYLERAGRPAAEEES